jgi:4-hydroxybenzoate polyprenyltransferase
MQTFVYLQEAINQLLMAFVCFATLALYNLHSIIGLMKSAAHPRYQIINDYKIVIKVITLVSAIASVLLVFLMPYSLYLPLFFVTFPSLLYVLPLFGGKRLRDFAFLKILILTTVWPMVTVMLPYACIGQTYDAKFVFLMAERAIFVFSIALAFDIRDFEFDKMLGVKTIPMLIGRAKCIKLAAFMLLVWILLNFYIYPAAIAIVFGIIALFTVFLIFGTLKKQPAIYYQFYLDGTLAIQAITVLIYSISH